MARLTKQDRAERDLQITLGWIRLGKPPAQLAKEFGLSKQRIQEIIRKNKNKPTPPPRKMTIGDDYAKYKMEQLGL